MKITNDTTTYQVAELMGSEADERDGRILLGLISRECIVDTEEVPETEWLALVDEAQQIRRNEDNAQEDPQAPQETRTDLELANFLLDNAKDYCTTKDGRVLINFHDKGVWRMIPGGETWAERETLVMHLLPKHRIIYATIAQAYEWLQTSEKFTYCIDELEISAHAANADFLVNKLEDRFLELLKLDGE